MIDRCRSICRGRFRPSTAPLSLPARPATSEGAMSNMELARVTNGRTSRLVQQGWAAVHQGDTDRLNFAAQTAAVGVARANLEGLSTTGGSPQGAPSSQGPPGFSCRERGSCYLQRYAGLREERAHAVRL